jgi:hypothetical protein
MTSKTNTPFKMHVFLVIFLTLYGPLRDSLNTYLNLLEKEKWPGQ